MDLLSAFASNYFQFLLSRDEAQSYRGSHGGSLAVSRGWSILRQGGGGEKERERSAGEREREREGTAGAVFLTAAPKLLSAICSNERL